jgi:hypothetical protein
VSEEGIPFVYHSVWYHDLKEARGGSYRLLHMPPSPEKILSVETKGPCVTTRTYKGSGPWPRGKVAEKLWCGVSVSTPLSFRADFNLAQFADYLVGWFGWDMLADDHPSAEETPEEPKQEGEEGN